MGRGTYSRREFISQAAALGGGIVVLGACSPGGTGGSTGSAELPPIEGASVITDPARIPRKFAESPDFQRLVNAGKLPPVAERVGQDPAVIKPAHSIGKYGGEMKRGYLGVGDHPNGRNFCGTDSLLTWNATGSEIVPNIARGYELSKDGKVLTLHLRRGMRWSDGEPFTADDLIFWREDLNLNGELSGGWVSMKTSAGPVQMKKLDDHTVEFVSPVPHPLLPEMLFEGPAINPGVNVGGFAPKHYLSKFLPRYTSMGEVEKKAKDAGFDSWSLHLLNQADFTLNTELPVVTPWVVTRPVNRSPWTFEANPYSIWVDTEGNQLPYIPKVTMKDAGNPEVLTSRAVSGSYTMQERGLALSSLQVLLKNQKRGEYKLYRAPNEELNIKVRINLAYDEDKVLGDLVRTVGFRRALSLGLDRKEINETFLLGAGTPTAAMVSDSNKYFPGTQWRKKWATHDVKQANSLLDEMGLDKKDGQGFRLRPDENERIRLEIQALKSVTDFVAIGEMVKAHWKQIGVDTTVVTVDPSLVTKNILGNSVMFMLLDGFSVDVLLLRTEVLPTDDVSGVIGIPYAKWFDSNGKAGKRPPESIGLEKAMDLWQRARQEVDEAKRVELGKQIYQMHADQVWSIGIAGFAPFRAGLYVVKSNVANVPRRYLNDQFVMRPPSKMYPATFYEK